MTLREQSLIDMMMSKFSGKSKRFFNFLVSYLDIGTNHAVDDMMAWCQENNIVFYSNGYGLNFLTEDEAILFRLRWCSC